MCLFGERCEKEELRAERQGKGGCVCVCVCEVSALPGYHSSGGGPWAKPHC